MWAMVKAGQVTAIYPRPKAITVDGVQHPVAEPDHNPVEDTNIDVRMKGKVYKAGRKAPM